MTERSKKQGTKGVLSLVEVFQTCAPKGQGSILSVLASELQSASTPKEKARWVQTALALTPYNANDTKKIKEKKLGLLRGVAEVSSKDAGGALKQAQEYVGDPDPVVRRAALWVAAEAAQHREYAEVALALADQLKNDQDWTVRSAALRVAKVAAQHLEHAGAALVLAGQLRNDPEDLVRYNALFVAAAAAQHSEHVKDALVLAGQLRNDPEDMVRYNALFVAAEAAQHPEHAGDALVFANQFKNDPDWAVRAGALAIAKVVAQHPEHAGAALALVQERADKDQNEDVRKLARSILEDAKPKPEGGKPAVAAGAAPAP